MREDHTARWHLRRPREQAGPYRWTVWRGAGRGRWEWGAWGVDAQRGQRFLGREDTFLRTEGGDIRLHGDVSVPNATELYGTNDRDGHISCEAHASPQNNSERPVSQHVCRYEVSK